MRKYIPFLILPFICLVGLIAILLSPRPEVVITDFVYEELDTDLISTPIANKNVSDDLFSSGYEQFERVIENVKSKRYGLTTPHYGLVAVVRPVKNENKLTWQDWGYTEPHMGHPGYLFVRDYMYLSPRYIYRDIISVSGVTVTTCEVVEVLHQTEETNYKPGDLIEVQEPYYVLDQRVPAMLEMHGATDYVVVNHGTNVWRYPVGKGYGPWQVIKETWYPMKNGETYFIMGFDYLRGDWNSIFDKETRGCVDLEGIYCLSDKTRRVGYSSPQYDWESKGAYAYIAEHFGY